MKTDISKIPTIEEVESAIAKMPPFAKLRMYGMAKEHQKRMELENSIREHFKPEIIDDVIIFDEKHAVVKYSKPILKFIGDKETWGIFAGGKRLNECFFNMDMAILGMMAEKYMVSTQFAYFAADMLKMFESQPNKK